MTRPRILMADDHRMLAEGLRSLLEPAYELVEIVEDGRGLVEAAGAASAGCDRGRHHHAPAKRPGRGRAAPPPGLPSQSDLSDDA